MSYTNILYPDDDPYDNKEWGLKKKIILTRDNFECQECNNETLMAKSIKGVIRKVEYYRNIKSIGMRSDERFYKNPYKIDYWDDLGIEYSRNVLSHLEIKDFDKFKNREIYLCTIRDKTKGGGFLQDIINQRVTDTIITCIKNPNSKGLADKWFYVRNLHVHHLNYPDRFPPILQLPLNQP